MPSLFKHNAIAHAAVDGWQISGLYRAQTGSPFGVGFSIPGIGNPQLTGSYTEGARIHLIGDPRQGTSDNPYNRINPAAFAPPGPGDLGLGAPQNYLTGPGINNWDMSVQKAFKVKERCELQLRADAFNMFNHTQFSGYNTTINYKSLTDASVTNLYLNANGTINNKNGFGTVSGARDPRIMQLMVRFRF